MSSYLAEFSRDPAEIRERWRLAMRKILNCLLGAALFAGLLPMSSFASRKTINLDSTFNGKITRNSDNREARHQFIFYDDATGMNYLLDSNRVGRTFDNQE